MVTATRELTVYDVFQGTQVRKVDRGDGKVWRVFADCCKALGFGNSRQVIKRIPSEHVHLMDILAADGKRYKTWVIDEIGLLDLIAYRRLSTKDPAGMEKLEAFRELIGQRAAAPDNALAQAINRLTDFMERTEARLTALEPKPTASVKQTAVAVLDAPIPEVSARLKISQVIRRFVARQSNGYTHQDAFDKLYYEYKYRYHVDLKERAKNAKATSIMDYAEYTDVKEGTHYVDELYGLAQLLFPEN